MAIVLVGALPKIDGTSIDRLFLRQGFRVIAVADGGEATTEDEPCLWVRYVASLPMGKSPLPEDGAVRFDSFDPTTIASTLEPAL